jgi:Cu/Zn superoxide dismutase
MFHIPDGVGNLGCDNGGNRLSFARALPPACPMRYLVLPLAILVLAACGGKSVLPNDPRELPEMLEPARPSASTAATATYVAQLKGIGGSSAQGRVNITQRGDDMVVELNLQNVGPGLYSWALHAVGNCSSTNGFSAGSPWVPAGVKKFPVDLLPDFLVNGDPGAFVVARVRGARITGDGGVNGRSVLIYEGGGIQPIKPGVPNNAVACGVFESARTIF